ncbi:serpin family protein [Streptomyces dysideae]|uniref:Proteinase inhibitor I4 serpin n=1 Tax=Streptomyces dysideae TaxID=909626 RepID=A0A101V3F4_9ACTN|nr:serpin family protein [Streptomyces dysideae]KUO21798.1 proteinase inhibitor I4 serpin [Streptomyces dysideae]
MSTIHAVNSLTARWAGTVEDGTVFSAAGVWPLLAFLADGADGPAREELAAALGVPADQAAAAARELLAAMDSMEGLDAALGLWTSRTLELHERWTAGLPAPARGVLTADPEADQRNLDAWAAKHTNGLIERMPVEVTGDTELLLADALVLRTRWLRPFERCPLRPAAGPWQGRTLRGLHRRSIRLDRIGVAATQGGQVTELKVLGDNGIDVHLLLGDERMTPGQVLGAGVALVDRRLTAVPGSRLPHGQAGPGVHVEEQQCTSPQPPSLDVRTVAYDVTADHDLLHRHALFGLTTARNTAYGHFPGVSAAPLAVAAAGQSALARFHELGFEAAAVTAVAATRGGAPPARRYLTTVVQAVFDRPFGFLAVHRETRLVLAAGWVTDPEPYREDGYR